MRRWKTIAVYLSFLVLLCAGAYTALMHLVPASIGYCLEARFESLPESDDGLQKWLQRQPGVVSHTVFIHRFGLDEKLVSIIFTQVRTGAGNPALPSIDAECQRLGYARPDGPFRYCVRSEKEWSKGVTLRKRP